MERVRTVGAGVGRATRHGVQLIERIRAFAEHHHQLPVRVELLNDVRALVDDPDVVVLVHANGVAERIPVALLAELFDESARLIEFEDP